MTTGRTLYLETMGCQMNALDSELVLGELLGGGFTLTDDIERAGLVVINTCSVRQHAEDKVYSRLGHLKSSRARNPEQIVSVIGCMAERDGDGLLAKMPNVDILCGPTELHRLPGMIEEVRAHRRPSIALSGRLRERSTNVSQAAGHDDLESLDSGRAYGASIHAAMPKVFGRQQAYVRITRGCNKFCTFCVVPYTRGAEAHRPADQIVEEVRRLADGGVVEVTLLGQTVNHYHHAGDGGRETNFAGLLRRVHDEVPQLPRLRFVTSFPRDFTDEALGVMAESPRICKYLHIPAQSGSDRILKAMNRGYTAESYRGLIDRARGMMPDLCIAGDMIVGFCGETEEDFEASLELLRQARYKNCFIFKYSPRPGTHADERLGDDVPELVKRRRNNDMLAVQAEICLDQNRGLIGRRVEVLVEGPSKAQVKRQESEQDRGHEVDGISVGGEGRSYPASHLTGRGGAEGDPAGRGARQFVGRTGGDQIVVFDTEEDPSGRMVEIEVVGATPHTLHGRIVGSPGGAASRAVGLSLPVLS